MDSCWFEILIDSVGSDRNFQIKEEFDSVDEALWFFNNCKSIETVAKVPFDEK